MKITILILLLGIKTTMAYPIFFKCSDNQELLESFSPEEQKELVQNLTQSEKCTVGDCVGQLKQVLEFGYKSHRMASMIYSVYKSEIKEISKKEYKGLSDNQKTFDLLRLCHFAQRTPRAESHSNYVPIYYPHDTTYQYITGHRKNNKNEYDGFAPLQKHVLREIIEESIRVGVDPLAVIGMASMERPGIGVEQYWKNMHDSRSQMVLGCARGKMGADGKPQIARHSKDFDQVAKDLGLDNTTGNPGYMCVGKASDKGKVDDVHGFAFFNTTNEAKISGRNCCVKTKYSIHHIDARKITTYLYFKQMQNLNHYNPMAGKKNQKSITHRLNTFWGASHTTGTYPSYRISPFRVGISTFEDPNYARQIMDFSLNSFMRNGDIVKMISDAEIKHKKKVKSFLCVGRPPGTYTIDSDYYLNKIKNTERLKPIKARFDAGASWNDLSIKHQSVLLQEFTYYKGKIDKDSASLRKIKSYLPASEHYKFEKAARDFYEYRNASIRRGRKLSNPFNNKEARDIFDKVYKIYFTKPDLYEHRKTLINAAKEDSELSWERVSDKDIKFIKDQIIDYYDEAY